jgi:MFS family permease
MNQSNKSIFKRYAYHTFLQWFSHSLLVAFGGLFIYAKTGSIGLALAVELASIVGDLTVRSPLVNWWWNILLKRRQVLSMTVGIIIAAVSFLGIFFTNPDYTWSTALFMIFSYFSSVGMSMYWIPSSALYVKSVGQSDTPGLHTSIITIVRVFAALLASVTGLILNAQDNFLLLLPIFSVVVLVSLIPLMRLNLQPEAPVSWRRAVGRISTECFWANFNSDFQLKMSGLPLILVLLYGSFSESVAIGGMTLFLAAILGYFAGKLKDTDNNYLFILSFVGLVFVWIAYSVMKAPIGFVIVGGLEYMLSAIVSIGRDARVSREIVNDGHSIEGAIAVEFARGIGITTGLLILIFAYWLTGTLPQAVLLAGALFVIPRGLYAIGVLDKLKTK